MVSAAARAISDSPSQEIAPQADKDLALAIANVGDLELMMDNAIRAMLNAQDYAPVGNKSGYICPECWVKEHLTAILQSFSRTTTTKNFKCLTCRFKFAYPTLPGVGGRVTQATNTDLSISTCFGRMSHIALKQCQRPLRSPKPFLRNPQRDVRNFGENVSENVLARRLSCVIVALDPRESQ